MELNLRQYTTKVDELSSYVHKIVTISFFPSFAFSFIFHFALFSFHLSLIYSLFLIFIQVQDTKLTVLDDKINELQVKVFADHDKLQRLSDFYSAYTHSTAQELAKMRERAKSPIPNPVCARTHAPFTQCTLN
jgi:hypothetical protein